MFAASMTATVNPPRKGWLEVSRPRAFLTHLGTSATIVGVACALVFFVWYPYPYFQAVGAWSVLRVLIGVDLVLGPLLTLVVFKPGKRGLKLDLAIIAVVQLAALVYGLTVVHRERPFFTVFALDRFYVLAEHEADPAQVAAAEASGRIDRQPRRGPLLVVANRPTDEAALRKLLEETVFGGRPDIERRPEFWRRFSDESRQIVERRRPLSQLRAARPDAARRIAALTADLGVAEDELGFLPLVGKNRDLSFIVDATGAPLGVLDVDPWIDSTPQQ